MPKRTVFICYSHRDEDWLTRLRVHLRSLEATHPDMLDLWDDSRLATGTIWRSQIKKALKSADIAILLVSPGFLGSDFILKEELPVLLSASRNRGLKIMPVVIKPCRFEKVESLAQFQSVNPPNQAMSKLPEWQQDQYWEKLTEDIAVTMAVPLAQSASPRGVKSRSARAEDGNIMSAVAKLNSLLEEARRKRFVFLLIGRTGVGKSSTVNSLVGEEVAKVNPFEPQTLQVKSYRSKVSGLTVIDTPGLCDDLPIKGKDKVYLELIAARARKFDCLWFIVPLPDKRISNDERRAVRLVTRAFGKDVWERAVIVFTFADLIPKAQYADVLLSRSRLVRQEIAVAAGASTAQLIPCVPVSNTGERTPNGKPWLGELVAKIAERISENGTLPFLVTVASRGDVTLDRNQGASVKAVAHAAVNREYPSGTSVLTGALAAVTLGGAISGATGGSFAGPAGMLVGAALGALAALIMRKNRTP